MDKGEQKFIGRLYTLVACGLIGIYALPFTDTLLAAQLVSTDNAITLWSEWEMVINYNSGWIRRGLLGALLANFTSINAYAITGALGMLLYLFFLLALFYRLLGRFNFIAIAIITSPFLAWHIIWDFEGFVFRKDYYVYSILLLHAFLILSENKQAWAEFTILILLFTTVLIHEMAVFTIPAHWMIYHRGNAVKAMRFRLPNLFEWGLFIIGIIGVIHALIPISTDDIALMCSALPDALEARCRVSGPMLSLIQSPDYFFSQPNTNPWNSLGSWLFLLAVWLINIIALFWLFSARQLKKTPKRQLFIALLSALTVLIPLVLLAIDWGRWLVLSFIVAITVIASSLGAAQINSRANYMHYGLLPTFIILFLAAIFFRVPHCCNLNEIGFLSQLWALKIAPLLAF